MRVLIFEPSSGGHRLTYVRQVLMGMRGLDALDPIVCVTDETMNTEAFAHQLGGFVDSVEVMSVDWSPGSNPRATAGARLVALSDAVLRAGPGHVLIPSGDGLAQSMGAPGGARALRGTSCEVVLHRGSFAYRRRGVRAQLSVRVGLGLLARGPFDRVHFVDVLAWEWLRGRGHPLAARSCVLPDPVDEAPAITREEARRNLGLPEGGRLLSSSGLQDTRKGADLVLGAFARAVREGRLGAEDRLLLAGRAVPEIRALYDGACRGLIEDGRLVALDRYISDDELAWSFAAGDAVVTAHPDHVGLSNIALRAVAAGRPVLASDHGWLGRVVGGFDVGWTVNVRDEAAFSAAMARALDEGASYRMSESGDRLKAFHTRENFTAHLMARCRARVGLGPDARALSWDWALGREAAAGA